MRISDWSSDVCSSDLRASQDRPPAAENLPAAGKTYLGVAAVEPARMVASDIVAAARDHPFRTRASLEPEAGLFQAPANHPAIQQELFALVADNIVSQNEDELAEEVGPFAEKLVGQQRTRGLEDDQ